MGSYEEDIIYTCNCLNGWTGRNCSFCSTNAVCLNNEICNGTCVWNNGFTGTNSKNYNFKGMFFKKSLTNRTSWTSMQFRQYLSIAPLDVDGCPWTSRFPKLPKNVDRRRKKLPNWYKWHKLSETAEIWPKASIKYNKSCLLHMSFNRF